MPASMMSAPTGGSPKVIGSNMATVATVPMPGSTPTNVPTKAPSRQKARLERRSVMMVRSVRRPELERQLQQIDEQPDAERRHRHRGDQAFLPAEFARPQNGDHEGKES